jgi:hypothetical protein
MNGFNAKSTGWVLLLAGAVGILAVVSLLLFFIGQFQDIPSLLFLGTLNDRINALAGILAAVLVSVIYPSLRRQTPRLSLLLLIDTWVGAISIIFGSWLIVTGRSDVELSSYYFFLGNGLIGIWLWVVNRIASQQAVWPAPLTRLGMIASGFMLIGLLGLYGILSGMDGGDYSPLLLTAGISFLGTGFLYPAWCLLLGRWILSGQNQDVVAIHG